MVNVAVVLGVTYSSICWCRSVLTPMLVCEIWGQFNFVLFRRMVDGFIEL